MEDNIPNGVLEDIRLLEEKEQDHLHEQLYSGMPAVWIEKPQNTWKLPSQRNQDGSNSCVAQSSATAMEILTGNIVSAAIYKLRADPTQGGMYLQNIGDILYNQGTILESACPSQNMNDPQIDAITLPPLYIKATGYRTFKTLDIDLIAQAIQAYGQSFIIFSSNTQEWQVIPVYLGTPITFGHCICATDFTLVNGVKYLICRDSAGQFSSPQGYRLISADYLAKRGKGAMYLLGGKIEKAVADQPVTNPVFKQQNWFRNLLAWLKLNIK